MTKEKLIALACDTLAGGSLVADLRGKIHPAVVEAALEVVYGDVIAQSPDNYLDSYVKAYNDIPVLYDAGRDEFYSILPSPVVQLPKNRGIRLISPTQEQSSRFVYSENNSSDTYSELEVGNMFNKVKYYVENTKIFYRDYNSNYTSVLMKLVVPFSEFSDEEDISMPNVNNAQIFAMLVQLLRQKPNEKNTDNNQSGK